jgi:hypothetical protein
VRLIKKVKASVCHCILPITIIIITLCVYARILFLLNLIVSRLELKSDTLAESACVHVAPFRAEVQYNIRSSLDTIQAQMRAVL